MVAGTSYFVADAKTDRKQVIKNVLTHPCLAAIYLGLFFWITQIRLPAAVTEPVRYIANCNTALTMFLVGTNFADIKLDTIVSRDTVLFGGFRLILLPAVMLGIGTILHLDPVSRGIAVIMTGMPAGATATIFAARYKSDADFAAGCVVFTTLLSMVTLPLWCFLVG